MPKSKIHSAFTLVELLVVIAILGILVTIGLSTFTSAQGRGRDAQRKSDLKQIASALELYYADYGSYPQANMGVIQACPSGVSSLPCPWGATDRSFSDPKNTIYMKLLPKDPLSDRNYWYRPVPAPGDTGVNKTGFQLFAGLENTQDQNCLPDNSGTPNCKSPANIPNGVSCGAGIVCNFSMMSANTKITDN